MDFTEAWEDTCSAIGLAARNGDVESLKNLIDEGVAVDIGDNRGWKPLHEAAASSIGVQCLEILLDHPKTNVNWPTHEGETALLLACKRRTRNMKEAVALLLQHEAQPNISDNDLETPILVATKKGDLSLVRLLISSNADVNMQDCSGWSSLHEAAKSNEKLDILKKLLASGAKLDCQDECGLTPIFVASQDGQVECLKTLLKIAKRQGLDNAVNIGAEDHATPLMLAAQQGFKDCMKILLSYGANANLCADDSGTALHSAVQGKHPDCLSLLINKMDLNPLIKSCHPSTFESTQGYKRISPIHLAIEWKSYDCLHLLLKAGFSFDSIKAVDEANFHPIFRLHSRTDSALAYAIASNDKTSVSMLVDAGACLDVPCKTAIHPVLKAIYFEKVKMVDYLLDKGSDVNYCDERLNNILVCAFVSPQWRKFLPMILRAGSNSRLCFVNSENIKIYLDSILRLMTAKAFAWKMMWILQFLVIDEFIQRAFIEIETKAKEKQRHQPETWKDINTILSQPSSLKHMCRMRIRESMYSKHGTRFRHLLTSLPVPSILAKYLSFKPLCEGKYLNPPTYTHSTIDEEIDEDLDEPN